MSEKYKPYFVAYCIACFIVVFGVAVHLASNARDNANAVPASSTTSVETTPIPVATPVPVAPVASANLACGVRDALLTGSPEALGAAMQALVAGYYNSRDTSQDAYSYADYYLHRDVVNTEVQANDAQIVASYCGSPSSLPGY